MKVYFKKQDQNMDAPWDANLNKTLDNAIFQQCSLIVLLKAIIEKQ